MIRFRWICWIPAALWIGTRRYVEGYDGWGRWAAAPLFLLPIAVSALFVGGALLFAGRRAGPEPDTGDWIAIGVSALPLLWFAFRAVVT